MVPRDECVPHQHLRQKQNIVQLEKKHKQPEQEVTHAIHGRHRYGHHNVCITSIGHGKEQRRRWAVRTRTRRCMQIPCRVYAMGCCIYMPLAKAAAPQALQLGALGPTYLLKQTQILYED